MLINTVHRLAAVIGLTIVLVSSLAHATSFIIELTNGRAITTRRVWEEGDELKFYVAEGTVGVPKAQVKRIQTSPLGSNDTVSRSALPLSPTDPKALARGERLQKPSHQNAEVRFEEGHSKPFPEEKRHGEIRLQEADAQSYRAKKLMLTGKLDEATNKHLEASAAKNPDSKKAALDDMREYSKQILDLGDEVKHKNGGVLPPWWNE
jgi:hypothetical protein